MLANFAVLVVRTTLAKIEQPTAIANWPRLTNRCDAWIAPVYGVARYFPFELAARRRASVASGLEANNVSYMRHC